MTRKHGSSESAKGNFDLGLITWRDRGLGQILMARRQLYSSQSSALQKELRWQNIVYTVRLNLLFCQGFVTKTWLCHNKKTSF